MNTLAPRHLATAVAVAITLALAGCGNDTGEPTSGAPSGGGEQVQVVENEFTITLSKKTFAPGTYTFAVTNSGKAPHDLALKGPGVNNARTPILKAGEKGSVTVALEKGTYALWCTVASHRAHGMETSITVA